MDADQRKLGALIESEKHSNNGHDKKSKNHATSKDTRVDILKNETKFKEQAGKIDALRKEVRHLEDELKSVTQTELSMMPEGLLQAISEAEARDLLAYLRSPAQVSMPVEQK